MSRLVQISIVRDERDVVEANLLHHRMVGVSAAAVIDNGSTDGTFEILESLSRRMDLVVIRKESLAKHDAVWREELLSLARDHLEGDWVVPVDADEFWIPPNGDLPSVLDESVGVLVARRDNVLPGAGLEQDDLGDFRRSVLRIRRPYPSHHWRDFATGSSEATPSFPLLFSEVCPKVLCRLEGLEELSYGFHEARHPAGCRELPDSVRLLHFPVRSLEQFEAKIRAHSRSHAMDWHRQDPARSWHLKYWDRRRKEGKLEAEYESYFLSRERREALLRKGVLSVLEPHPIGFESAVAPTAHPGLRASSALGL